MPLVPQRLLEEITDSLSDDDLGLLPALRSLVAELFIDPSHTYRLRFSDDDEPAPSPTGF